MGRTRNTLTPMIGLSLAALVAGSLITLAVLAQRVSLDVPYAQPVEPRQPQSAASAPPLVVDNPPPASADNLDQDRLRDLDLPPDRVLPLRIDRTAAPGPIRRPAQPGNGNGKGPEGPKERGPQNGSVQGLPPGIIKKINRGGGLPPGHAKRAAAGAKPHPPQPKSRGRGACGEPPCGNAYGHVSTPAKIVHKGKAIDPSHGKADGHSNGKGRGK